MRNSVFRENVNNNFDIIKDVITERIDFVKTSKGTQIINRFFLFEHIELY